MHSHNNKDMGLLYVDNYLYSANANLEWKNNRINIINASKINIQTSERNIFIDNHGIATLSLIGNELKGYEKESVLILVDNTRFTPAENSVSLREITLAQELETLKSCGFFKLSMPEISKEQIQLLQDARNGDWQAVRAAGEKSINCNIRSPEGYTPLYIATEYGHTMVVRELLKMNANVNQPDHEGTTPAWIAASLNHADILTLLAKNKAELNTKWKNQTILDVAIRKGHTRIIHILSHYIDIHAEEAGTLPLHAATQFDSECGFIISNTIPENLAYEHYILTDSSLIHCLPYEKVEYVTKKASELIALKAKFTKNIERLSSAQLGSIASITGISTMRKNERVQALLDCQMNPDRKNQVGQSPMFWAIDHDNAKLVEIYARYGANVNLIVNGSSILHLAAEKGNLDIFKILLNYGANYLLSIEYGMTPLFIAAQYNHKDIVTLYLKRYQFENLLSEATFPVEYLRTFAKKRGEEIVQRMEVLIHKKLQTGENLIPVNACDIARIMGNQEIVALFEDLPSHQSESFMYVGFG